MLKLENHQVVGQKGILIKLEEYQSETTTTDEGIIIPLYENYETDGGRPASRIKQGTESAYSTIGQIIQISNKAREVLEDEKIDVKVGDYITISPLHKHPSNEFLIERDLQVIDFSGYLRIYPNMIESKLVNYKND